MSKRVSVVGNSALAGMAVFLAWRMSNNIMFVFAAGCLCAVFAERAWNTALPDGVHLRLWPLK
jgi:hypothetical protein